MHILLIHQAFANLDEAGGTRHAEMAAYFARCGHRVTIIASPVSYLTGKSRESKFNWAETSEIGAGITLIRTYTYAALHRSFFHRVLAFLSFMVSSFFAGIRIKNVDLVWGTSPPIFQAFTAWLLAKIKRVPFLFEVRDLWPAFAIAVGVLRNRLLISLSNWLEKFLYRQADRLVVNSPGFIDHVLSRGAKWVELVPNGADPSMFKPDTQSNLRESLGLTEKFVVLYAGAHGISNDLHVVLDAAMVLENERDVIFLLVGDGKEKANLVAQAKIKGLSNVIFLSPLPKNQIAGMLSMADACLAILKPLDMYKTTYPNKVFDYMAAGKPVICAIDGVIRDVVEQFNAGVFVQPGNVAALAEAVRMLYNHRDTAQTMGQNGRMCVEQNFHRAVIARRMVLLMEEMRRNRD